MFELTQRCKEPPILPTQIPLLQRLLHRLLRLFPLAHLAESIIRYHALQTLQFEGVPRGHQVVVVDDFDEGLDLAALGLAGFRHSAGDLQRGAFDAGDECVWERVLLAAIVLRLDDDDFLACVAAAADDGLGVC